jgi:hypothetical protein
MKNPFSAKAAKEATEWARKYKETFQARATSEETMDVLEDILVNYLCLYDTLENQEMVIKHNVALQILARMGIVHDDNVREILRADLGIPIPQLSLTTEEAEDVPRR